MGSVNRMAGFPKLEKASYCNDQGRIGRDRDGTAGEIIYRTEN